jgi:hypothetical protein
MFFQLAFTFEAERDLRNEFRSYKVEKYLKSGAIPGDGVNPIR